MNFPNKYNIKITVLTPVHIGTSKDEQLIPNVDFVQRGEYVFFIDKQKLTAKFEPSELVELLLNGTLENKLNDLNIEELKKISQKEFILPEKVQLGNMPITPQVRNPLTDKPIIPGSSLKGAIRTVLLNYFIKQTNNKPNNKNEIQALFGNPNTGNDIMRFIKIADAEFSETQLYPVKIFSLDHNKQGGWKHHRINRTTQEFNKSDFVSVYETIEMNDEAQSSINIEKEYFEWFNREVKKGSPAHTHDIMKGNVFENLCKIINDCTKQFLKKERDYHKKYSQEDYSDVIDSVYDWLLGKIPQDNKSCILRVGFGSGFHAITGDWQYNDHINTGQWGNPFPKTKDGKDNPFFDKQYYRFALMKQAKSLRGKPRWKTRRFAFKEDKNLRFYPLGYIKLELTN